MYVLITGFSTKSQVNRGSTEPGFERSFREDSLSETKRECKAAK